MYLVTLPFCLQKRLLHAATQLQERNTFNIQNALHLSKLTHHRLRIVLLCTC